VLLPDRGLAVAKPSLNQQPHIMIVRRDRGGSLHGQSLKSRAQADQMPTVGI
jgi:hypothetical protein